jgi:hypothetical protein
MLFSSVADASGSDQNADLILQIIDIPRRPYYTEPSHNPAFVLLSIALPFWWSEEYGYRLSGQCARTGETLNVDTTREGTAVMWSLAPVLNLSPDRGFRENPRREASQILLQLQPLLERCAVEPTASSDRTAGIAALILVPSDGGDAAH